MQQIFISQNKGDFLYAEWEQEDMQQYKLKREELLAEGYEFIDGWSDYLNEYEVYSKDGKEIMLTILCC